MDIGLVCFPYSLSQIAKVAKIADSADGPPPLLGIPDSPMLFSEAYVATQAALGGTSRVCAGPFSTNPVTRHWSVHAAIHNSLEQRYPGRAFLSLAPGDSAVHSYGLSPATRPALLEHARAVKANGPSSLRLFTAAGGLRSAETAALATDEVVFGQGNDPGCFERLSSAANEARAKAGKDEPLRPWLYVLADIWASDEDRGDVAEREAFKSMLMAYSRQAMATTFEGKNVPKSLHSGLRDLYSDFRFEEYGGTHNAGLLARHDAEFSYLRNRFCVTGSPEDVATQLDVAVTENGAAGVWVGFLTKSADRAVSGFIDKALPTLSHGPRPSNRGLPG